MTDATLPGERVELALATFSCLLRSRQPPTDREEREAFLIFCAQHRHESQAQLFQDLFVRWQLGDKRKGFFVEFGAANGVHLSNSKSLEGYRQWRGILAEPARCWHAPLKKYRGCAIDLRCVWTHTGETLRFNEATAGELSTLESFSDRDHHAESRKKGSVYDVQTVSLNDLLADHKAPAEMDYLSIDTEGSELAILTNFDFDRFRFRIITVEHNHTPDRDKLFELLTGHGYQRKFTEFSRFDDWYVHSSVEQKAPA